MAVKSTDTKSTAAAAKDDQSAAPKDDPSAPAATTPADPAPPAPADPQASGRVDSDCVVEESFHVGRAVNGKVCSYHAMHYKADGTRR